MAAVGEEFSLLLSFNTLKLGPDFLWFNPPKQFVTKQNGASGIKVFAVRCRKFLTTNYHACFVISYFVLLYF